METVTIHPFEKAGLGLAPFRCTGMVEKVGPLTISESNGVTLTVGSPGQPMGTCKFCGQSIRYCFEITSADGKRFIVGSDCVMKTDRPSAISDFDRVLARHKKDLAATKKKAEATRIEAAFSKVDASEWARFALSQLPHPYGFTNLTALDYVQYMRKSAGHSGKLKAVRYLKAKGLVP